jgi:hypothetical protein
VCVAAKEEEGGSRRAADHVYVARSGGLIDAYTARTPLIPWLYLARAELYGMRDVLV